MENITEALKMASAVLLFIIALSVGMYVINQSKMASDAVLYATDKYEFIDYTDELGTDDEIRASQKRKVGIETIIPTLYKYATEKYTIIFKDGTNSGYEPEKGTFATEPSYMRIYFTTNSNYDVTWRANRTETRKDYVNPYLDGKNKENDQTYPAIGSLATGICIFDEGDENSRQELFRGSQAERKKFLDALIYGGIYLNPKYNAYSTGSSNTCDIRVKPMSKDTEGYDIKVEKGLLEEFSQSVFLEEVGEYNYKVKQTDEEGDDYESGEDTESTSTRNTKRIITYTLITK